MQPGFGRVAPRWRSRRARLAAWTAQREETLDERAGKYRTFQQKIEIVLAGLRGDRPIKELCREREIAGVLQLARQAEGGRVALAGKEERTGENELRRRTRELERALGRKTYELEIAGEALRVWT